MNDTMDLKKFLDILRRRIMVIIVTASLMFLTTAAVLLFVIKPSYEATEFIIVGDLNRSEENYVALQEIDMLLASSLDLIKSPVILDSVKSQLDFPVDDLSEQISLQNNDNSQVINVIVRDHDPEKARDIASAVAYTSVDNLNHSFGVDHIQVLRGSNNEVTPQQVGSTVLNLAIGLAVSVLFGVAMAMFRENLDNSIKSRRETEEQLGFTVLGDIDLKSKQRKSYQLHPQIPVQEEDRKGEFARVQDLKH
ncbi:YveK family protein [Alteribacillus sp. HJP-4]|uniref:YveK family protein n=1 Tax=Alteribacillus sp. HJP-4 TaxID=2775394 RepID=UPI0035CD26CA